MSTSDVGYRRPPKQHQFKQGVSGNPKGRPPNAQPDLVAMLDDPVLAKRGGKMVEMQPGEVALRRVFAKAVKDRNLGAIKHVISMLIKYEAWSSADLKDQGGVVAMPSNLPFRMGSMALQAIGAPDSWTEENLKPVREAYLASRSDEEVRIDTAMGYFD